MPDNLVNGALRDNRDHTSSGVPEAPTGGSGSDPDATDEDGACLERMLGDRCSFLDDRLGDVESETSSTLICRLC